jgi:hypothetical protein
MDTQGAWDSEMSKHQSSTIFGLTCLLSSKLIYNIQNRLEEDKITNLDYFVQFAQAACNRSNRKSEDSSFLGSLQFLVRDWQNYEEGWNVAQCKESMDKHLESFMNPAAQDKKEIVDRLKNSFKSVDIFGLTHPSIKVTKPNYDGSLKVIEQDFFQLLDSFVEQFFGDGFPVPSCPLGGEIKTNDFKTIVSQFVKAFADNQDMAIGLTEAFVKVRVSQEKEGKIHEFRKWVADNHPDSTVMDPVQLAKELEEQIQHVKEEFEAELQVFTDALGAEYQTYVANFVAELEGVATVRINSNIAMVDSAGMKIVATPVIGVAGWFAATHAWIIAVGGALVTFVEFQKQKVRQKKAIYSPEVFKGVAVDVKQFFVNRWKDLQAMLIAAQRLEPAKVMDQLTGAAAKASAVGQMAMAAAAGDGAAGEEGKEK